MSKPTKSRHFISEREASHRRKKRSRKRTTNNESGSDSNKASSKKRSRSEDLRSAQKIVRRFRGSNDKKTPSFKELNPSTEQNKDSQQKKRREHFKATSERFQAHKRKKRDASQTEESTDRHERTTRALKHLKKSKEKSKSKENSKSKRIRTDRSQDRISSSKSSSRTRKRNPQKSRSQRTESKRAAQRTHSAFLAASKHFKHRSSKSSRPYVVNLKLERENLGSSRQEISEQTGIPLQYIEALETGEMRSIKKPRLLTKYAKQYLSYLDLPPTASLHHRIPSVRPQKSSTIFHTITTTAIETYQQKSIFYIGSLAFALILVLVGILKTVDHMNISTTPAESTSKNRTIEQSPAPIPYNGTVSLKGIDHIKAKVWIDGELKYDKFLPPLKLMPFHYQQELTVELNRVDAIEISHNGKKIRPQGNLNGKRRIVFAKSRESLSQSRQH